MRNKIEWSSTIAALILAGICCLFFFADPTSLSMYFDKYKNFIKAIILLPVTALVLTYLSRVIDIIRSRNKIYVSYSHKDEDMADQIIEYIKQSPKIKHYYTVRSDKDLKMGENIDKRIKTDISEAGIIILIVSDSYLSSPSCSKELEYITNDRATIIPIFLPSMENLDSVPEDVKKYKGIHLIQGTPENINKDVNKVIDDIVGS